MTPTPDTPNRTPEEIVAAAFTAAREPEYKIPDPQDEEDAAIAVRALREVGLLMAAPTEVTGSTSDGHHTFDELYAYRMAYHAHAAAGWLATGIPVVKSWRHSDGDLCFGGGWFIVVADLPTGQVSNHYREEYWDLFAVPSADPPEYDGHTPAEGLQRLLAAAGVAPQEKPEPGKRLDPDFRAELVDFATASIQDVWKDVPGGVDAETLAQNVVGAQEFAWISRGFPVVPDEPSEECTCPSGDGSLRWPCPTHPPAPSPAREKRWTLRPSRDDGYELAWFDGKRTEGWWLSAEQADALRPALAAVPDETELAEVIEAAEMDWNLAFDVYRSQTGADPGPKADFVARVVREWWEKKR